MRDMGRAFCLQLWSNISKEAIDLVKKLLTTSPEMRLSAAETLEHPWLADEDTIGKAKTLMGSQQRHSSLACSALEGILPKEWEIVTTPKVEGKKRPAMDKEKHENANSAAKRKKADL